jgi:hypothetical protein
MISKYKISLLTSGLHFTRREQFTNLLTTNLNLELALTYNLNLKLHSTSRWSFHTRLFTGHPSSSSSKNSPGKGDHQRTTCQAGSCICPPALNKHRGRDPRKTQPDYSRRTSSGPGPRRRRPVTNTKNSRSKAR